MLNKQILILLSGVLLAAATQVSAGEETPALLFKNARASEVEGKEQNLRTAVYLLERIRQDFPEWNKQTVEMVLVSCRKKLRRIAPPAPVGTPSREFPVTCRFNFPPFSASDKFEAEDGGVYRITLKGEDRHHLELAYRKLKPYSEPARICIQLRNTDGTVLLPDQKNPGLFSSQTGEYPLSLDIPAGSLFYLARFADDPRVDPVILSNIVSLP